MSKDQGNRKPGSHSRKNRSRIFRILLIQAVVGLLLATGLLLDDLVTAYSSFIGSILYLLPTLYFANRALRTSVGQSAKQALAEMYVCQIWKMALTAVGFAAVFILVKPVNPFSLFGTFILMQILSWIGQMNLNNRFLKL